jgi:hypothetical protein
MVKKQVAHASNKSRYLWLMPLAITAGLTWWLGIAIWPLVVVWIFIAYYTISFIRGNSLSLLSLAVLYVIMAAFCSGGSALGIALWNLNPGGSVASLLWFTLPLNLPLLIAFLAYFTYKSQPLVSSKAGSIVTTNQHLLMKSFGVIAGAVVVLNLYVAVAVLGLNLVSLFALCATGIALVGVKRESWIAVVVSLILFGTSLGFLIDNVMNDPQAGSSVNAISALCTIVVILLTYMLGRTFILRNPRK